MELDTDGAEDHGLEAEAAEEAVDEISPGTAEEATGATRLRKGKTQVAASENEPLFAIAAKAGSAPREIAGDVAERPEETEEEDDFPKATTFWIHEGLICRRSDFFRRALNGLWKEADEKVVKLAGDNPEDFKAYLALLYSGRACVLSGKDGEADNYTRLCRLFVLADKLQENKSKDIVIDVLASEVDKGNDSPSASDTRFVYDNTSELWTLRRLLVDAHAIYANESMLFDDTDYDLYPKRFFFDLTNASLNILIKGSERTDLGDPSIYFSKELRS